MLDQLIAVSMYVFGIALGFWCGWFCRGARDHSRRMKALANCPLTWVMRTEKWKRGHA